MKDLTTDALLNPNAMIYSYLDKTQVHLLAEQKLYERKELGIFDVRPAHFRAVASKGKEKYYLRGI
ncbi:MAG: hypothetical protein RQM89_11590 [Acetomicrobium sp.]